MKGNESGCLPVVGCVIQQAIAQVLTPLYDGDFSQHSYGFRPGRSAHQAVRHVESGWKQRKRYAVDCDLKAFFDTVNHDKLLTQLRAKIGGGKLLRLIGRYLRAGVELPDGSREATPLGVPQGGPLSPLLANIVLAPLDKELEHRGHHFARYADDFVILVKSAKAAERVMGSVMNCVEKNLGLIVNRIKSSSGKLADTTFLGFQISARGKVKWSAKAHDRFKQRVREPELSGDRQPPGCPQGECNESNHRAQPWAKCAVRHQRTAALCHGLDELLRHQPHVCHGAGTRGMDAKEGPALSLETMEETGDAAAQPHQAGNRSRRGAPRQPQPQRVLAHESKLIQSPPPAPSPHAGQPVGCRPRGYHHRSAVSCATP